MRDPFSNWFVESISWRCNLSLDISQRSNSDNREGSWNIFTRLSCWKISRSMYKCRFNFVLQYPNFCFFFLSRWRIKITILSVELVIDQTIFESLNEYFVINRPNSARLLLMFQSEESFYRIMRRRLIRYKLTSRLWPRSRVCSESPCIDGRIAVYVCVTDRCVTSVRISYLH